MNTKRKFESKPVQKPALIALVAVLVGFGILTSFALQSAFPGNDNEADGSNLAATGGSQSYESGNLSMRQGSEILSTKSKDHDSVRQTAKDLDRQLLARLEDRNRERDRQADLAGDSNYDAEEYARRVTEDYKQVKKAKQLSDSMKADYKKHYRNITRDN